MTRKEFTDAVRQHRQMFIKLSQKYVRNPEDARDAVQQGITDRLESCEQFVLAGKAHVSSWLAQAVISRAIDMARVRERHAEIVFDDLEAGLDVSEHNHSTGNRDLDTEKASGQFILDAQHALAPDAEQTTILTRDVRAALLKLPEAERMLLERVYMNGETFEEIAAETGKHKTTLMRRLARAAEKLRALLADYCPPTAKEAQLRRGA